MDDVVVHAGDGAPGNGRVGRKAAHRPCLKEVHNPAS